MTSLTTAGLHISEVAQRTGFSGPTLRYYEDIGLLPAPDRTPAGYRIYRDRDVARLDFIARAKRLGCSLDEIQGLVEAWDQDRCARSNTSSARWWAASSTTLEARSQT